MKFKVIAFGEDGKVFVGQDPDLSDAVADLSECVIATGSTKDQVSLGYNLHHLRAVASSLPDDYFRLTYDRLPGHGRVQGHELFSQPRGLAQGPVVLRDRQDTRDGDAPDAQGHSSDCARSAGLAR